MEPTTVNLRQVLARMNSPSVVTVRQILTMMPLLGYAELGRFLNCRAGEMWIGRVLPRGGYGKFVNSRATACSARRARGGRMTPARVVHHLVPHRGDWRLFRDPANWESLCKACHDAIEQSTERGGYDKTGGAGRWAGAG